MKHIKNFPTENTKISKKNQNIGQLKKIVFSRYFISAIMIVLELAEIILPIKFMSKIFMPLWVTASAINLAVYLKIVNSDTIPEYKIPWLTIVLLMPPFGAILYAMFYSRRPSHKTQEHYGKIKNAASLIKTSALPLERLMNDNRSAYTKAYGLLKDSRSKLYVNTQSQYFTSGEQMYKSLLEDLKKAEKFIFMEYFIIECGLMWNTVLNILKKKAREGVEVRIMYDDIGCMLTLTPNYNEIIEKLGIKCRQFSKISGRATSSHNNRDHRKITVIDGKTAYTGGINMADEYINHVKKYGYWKDTAIKLTGDAVQGFCAMFLINWDTNSGYEISDYQKYCKPTMQNINCENGYYIPFGDGPSPLYPETVSKNAFLNIINQAQEYVYITTPYFIIDTELTNSLINASKRGVDVRIITPHIPDKKIIHLMTRSAYNHLIKYGVKFFEFTPGFIHAKSIVSDDAYSIIGTVNFDYRSLVHHFEDGVWIYKSETVLKIKRDFLSTQKLSERISKKTLKITLFQRIIKIFVKIAAPLL